MLDIALTIFRETKKPVPFTELADQVAKIREMSKEEQKQRIAQFYTDINIDGRFVCIGDNQWGLKSWYPVESSEEELATTIKPKKRKKAKAKAGDDDMDFEDYEDLEEDYDDLDEDNIDDDEEDVDAADEEFIDYPVDSEVETDGDDDEEDEDEEEYEDEYDLEDDAKKDK